HTHTDTHAHAYAHTHTLTHTHTHTHLHEAKGTLPLAGHSLALLGARATLAQRPAVGVRLGANRALEGAAGDQTAAQLLTCRGRHTNTNTYTQPTNISTSLAL